MMTTNILDRFRRITSGARIIPEVEGLRFVAISTIFLFHLAEQLMKKKAQGFEFSVTGRILLALIINLDVGIPLFFTISAFILALRFAKQHLQDGPPVSLSAYYLRRLTRLEPPYIISLFITIPFAVIVSGGLSHVRALIPHFLASTTYTHGLFYGSRSLINGVTWSLEVEVQFYILAPLFGLVYLLRARSARYVSYVVVALLAESWQHFHTSVAAQLFLPFYLQFFAAGFFLADVYVDVWKGAPARNRIGDVISLLGWVLLFALMIADGNYRFFLPLAVVLAYAGAFCGTWTSRTLSQPLIATIGGMCYTIYLYHFTIIIVLSRLTFRVVRSHSFYLNFAEQTVLLGSITLAFSFLLFALFERPFMERHWPRIMVARIRSMTRRSSLPRAGTL